MPLRLAAGGVGDICRFFATGGERRALGECRRGGGSGVGERFPYRPRGGTTSFVRLARFVWRLRLGDLYPVFFVALKRLRLEDGDGDRLEFELDPDCEVLMKKCSRFLIHISKAILFIFLP